MKRSIHHLIADGVVGGLLAGLVVALWFLVVDSVAGRPFHTPAALAGALTRQPIGPPTFRLVAAYSVVHFAVFALLGIGVAGAIAVLRTPPRLLFGVLFGLVAQELAFYAGLLLRDASRVAIVPWPRGISIRSALVLSKATRCSRRVSSPGWSGPGWWRSGSSCSTSPPATRCARRPPSARPCCSARPTWGRLT